MPSKFAGEDALAFQEGPADPIAPVNYVQKRLQKRKGVEVVFDPQAHKYATISLRYAYQGSSSSLMCHLA